MIEKIISDLFIVGIILVLLTVVLIQVEIPNSITLVVEIGVGIIIAIIVYQRSKQLSDDVQSKQDELILQKKKITIENLFLITMDIAHDVHSIEEEIKKHNSAMMGNVGLYVTSAEGNVSSFEIIFGGNFSYLDLEMAKTMSRFSSFLRHLHQVKVYLIILRRQPELTTVKNLNTIISII